MAAGLCPECTQGKTVNCTLEYLGQDDELRTCATQLKPDLTEGELQNLAPGCIPPVREAKHQALLAAINNPTAEIVHAVMYRDYKIGTICDSGAWGAPNLFTAVTDHVTCPACRTKLEGGRAAAGIEPLPAVGYKAQGQTDIERFQIMARRLRLNQDIGGSNQRDALARLIDREIARAGGTQ